MTKADKINKAIADGMAVTVATAYRTTTVKRRHVAAWEKAGFPFFKADGNGATLMITRQSKGRPVYDCVDGARITAS